MFGETPISYVKIWNHPIETTIYKWLALGIQVLIYLLKALFSDRCGVCMCAGWVPSTNCHVQFVRVRFGLQSNRSLKHKNVGGGNSNLFYFHPYLGNISNLFNIFQMGWNHQLETVWKQNKSRSLCQRRFLYDICIDHLLHSFCHFRVVHVVWEFASSTDFVEVPCFSLSRRLSKIMVEVPATCSPKGLVFSWPQKPCQRSPISFYQKPHQKYHWFLLWILRLPPAEKPLKRLGGDRPSRSSPTAGFSFEGLAAPKV